MEDQNIILEDYPSGLEFNGSNGLIKNHGYNGYRISSLDDVNGAQKKPYPAIKLLMYHRIVEDRELSDHCVFCVHVREFCRQMEMLLQLGYTPVTLHDISLFRQGELQLPKKPVVITFDDGYMDTFTIAYPILVDNGMRAVVFVLGDREMKTNEWDRNKKHIPVTSLMEDHHVQELHSRGFEIGAHTMSHAGLVQLPEDDAYYEIKYSKLNLESLLGASVESFSYPHGLVSPDIKSMTAETGYQFGCGVYSGPARFGEDLFEIRRFTILNSTSPADFLVRLTTPFEYVEWMWWKTKRIREQYA